jgi:DNA-directed RNA polymerase subunit RPC12/RpoP
MNCTICGKKMNYTGFGNYRCQECGHAMNDLINRPSSCDIPMPQDFGKQEGWVCPVCGRGVAPWVDVCPCQGSEMKITYGTGTLNLPEYDLTKYTTNCGEDVKL